VDAKDSKNGDSSKSHTDSNGRKLLTVSIAAYNVEDYIEKALDSCLIPHIDLLDIIVVDDGSTDDTSTKAKLYQERYPSSITVVEKENGGYGSTLNTSLLLARGKYFRYLDGDDWFDSAQLDRLVQLLNKIEDDVIITPYVKRYERSQESELIDQLSNTEEGSYPFNELSINQGMTCPITYRTEVLRNANVVFTEHCFYVDNEYALLPMRDVKTATVLHLPLYQYRIGREGQSVSIKAIVKHLDDQKIIAYRLLDEFSEDGLFEGQYPAKEFVITKLYGITMSVYRNLLLANPSKKNKASLIQFDARLQGYPQLYKLIRQRSRIVKVLHSTHYFGYRLLHTYMIVKYRQGVVV